MPVSVSVPPPVLIRLPRVGIDAKDAMRVVSTWTSVCHSVTMPVATLV
ncbi:hypothetical protein JHFBIEKO_4625 [Methylobacterium mesophilicum]|nr:hypothetical protein JHFBIEKO_4625 [Methylobacterium mesophilicum]